MFADDTNILIENNNKTLLDQNYTIILNKFAAWFSSNKVNSNCEKTCTVLFKTPRDSLDMLLVNTNLGDLKSIECTKFLGITIHSKLSRNAQIINANKPLNSAIYAMLQIRDNYSSNTFSRTFRITLSFTLEYILFFNFS